MNPLNDSQFAVTYTRYFKVALKSKLPTIQVKISDMSQSILFRYTYYK